MPIPNPKVRPHTFSDQRQTSQGQKENWEESKNEKLRLHRSNVFLKSFLLKQDIQPTS